MKPVTERQLVAEYYRVARRLRLKLPPVSIRFAEVPNFAYADCRQYPPQGKIRHVRIRLEKRFRWMTGIALTNLYHEIAHIVARQVEGYEDRHPSHGLAFRRAMTRLLLAGFW